MHPFTENDRKSGLSKIARICLCILFAFSATGPVLIASAAPVGNFTYEYDYGNFSVIHTWTADSGNMTGSFNVSCNDEWYNSTWNDDSNWHGDTWYNGTVAKFNDTDPAHWSNITVYAYNATNSGLSYIGSNSVPIDNTPIHITDIDPEITVTEGETIHVDANFTDRDNDTPLFSCNMTDFDFNNDTGEGSWTTGPDDVGVHYVNFSVSDGYGSSDSAVMKITVDDSNKAPELAAIGNKNINETETLSFNISATDPDGDDIIYSAENVPAGAIFNSDKRTFNWTTDYNDSGSYDVTFIATANGLNDSETITITVENVNRNPVLGAVDPQEIKENEPLSINLIGTDPDNDDLIYSSTNKPEGSKLNSTTGLFEWTPDFDQDDVYFIQFNVTDIHGSNDSMIMEITVENVNRPPQMAALNDVVIPENSTLEIDLGAFDPDGDLLSYEKDLPNGSIINGNFTWDIGFEDNGTYDAKFTISDGNLDVNQSITITVTDVNRAPILDPISSVAVNETETVRINLTATDPDGDSPLFYTKDVKLGTLEGNNFTWEPDYTHQGTYYVNFTVSDGELFDTKMAVIGVNDTNAPPIFNSIGQQNVSEGEYLSFTVSASDVDGDKLNYTVSGDPSSATVTFGDSVDLSWTPSYDEAGTYNVIFTVSDGVYKDVLKVPIVVSNVNRAPSFNLTELEYEINESETLTIDLVADDPDNDPITVWVNNSDGASGTLNGDIYTWDTDYLDSGTYNIEFAVSDGNLNNTSTAIVTINDVNAPPEFTSVSSKVVEVSENLQFSINATDIDEDTLSYSVVGTLPTNATFDNETRLFDWTPIDGQEGTHSVQFKVTDGVDSDYLTVSITVKDSSTSTSSSSSSGGGGGGGGGSTAEKYENIDFKDYVLKYVVKDVETVFSFGKEDNSIISVSFTTSLNGGQTKAVVEMLKDTSTLVSEAPPGTVYKNLNIWVGEGKILPSMISDAKVVFKVEKSWIDANDIDPDSIKLLRYSGKQWNHLSTSKTGENDEYFYYVAETPGFSPFAISSVEEEETTIAETNDDVAETISDGEAVMKSVEDTDVPQSDAASQEEKSTGSVLLVIILLGVIVVSGLFGYNNREYCESCYEKARLRYGNPDGKRYRRVRK